MMHVMDTNGLGGHSMYTPAKLFLGGISWETSEDGLREHFSRYGTIADCVIMSDPQTHRPRGFGFVTFEDPICALEASREQFQIIDGRKVEVKAAVPKETMANQIRTKKIFVGGIPWNLTNEIMQHYFSQFGNILEVQIIRDHSSGKSRGFGYVTFDNEDTVDKVVELPHKISDKKVDVKKAVPKNSYLGDRRRRDARLQHLPHSLSPLMNGRNPIDIQSLVSDHMSLHHTRHTPSSYHRDYTHHHLTNQHPDSYGYPSHNGLMSHGGYSHHPSFDELNAPYPSPTPRLDQSRMPVSDLFLDQSSQINTSSFTNNYSYERPEISFSRVGTSVFPYSSPMPHPEAYEPPRSVSRNDGLGSSNHHHHELTSAQFVHNMLFPHQRMTSSSLSRPLGALPGDPPVPVGDSSVLNISETSTAQRLDAERAVYDGLVTDLAAGFESAVTLSDRNVNSGSPNRALNGTNGAGASSQGYSSPLLGRLARVGGVTPNGMPHDESSSDPDDVLSVAVAAVVDSFEPKH